MTIAISREAESVMYTTSGGVQVRRRSTPIPVPGAIEPVIDALDSRQGVLLASSYEYPGRYTRWDIGFVDPPLEFVARDRLFSITALNDRGGVLIPAVAEALAGSDAVVDLLVTESLVSGSVAQPERRFAEEERSKQRSTFTVIRALIDLFRSPEESHLGFYGAFGYDLAFQFEPVDKRIERPVNQRDLVLYLPDRLVIVDHARNLATRHDYEFSFRDGSTNGMPRDKTLAGYSGSAAVERASDHEAGEFAATVEVAKESFRRGDLFEVVPGRLFYEPCPTPPSELFRRLRERNPAPYGALMNLGENEYLVSASPEMYVRVEGTRVETCPISGTIARGQDVMGDAARILELLNSEKDASELTMCTDVDRNDKSRVCIPGSVKVIGRRQIEMYSRLIHTVDHVEGYLRDGCDAIDAFLSHAWAVTVTGAPKLWAMRFIEEHERSNRAWYGGAIGFVGFDGSMNTGLTLRTIRIKDGVAEIRAGATLLIDSDPEAEEQEVELKVAALIDAVRRANPVAGAVAGEPTIPVGSGKRVMLIDYEDSFVHTLGNYVRRTGAEVSTVRGGIPRDELAAEIERYGPDAIILSPGPGEPSDLDVQGAVALAVERRLPVLGVCLGLQGIAEHFGGKLGTLSYPMHGKASDIEILGGRLFEGLPPKFKAGRYHSLHAIRESLPPELVVTAVADGDVVMAIEHQTLPVAGVQFHPESILTLDDEVGYRIITNWMRSFVAQSSAAGDG